MASRPDGLTAYRIADSRFPIYSAAGSLRRPGRWHSGRLPVIYTALSFAGAMLERLAQTGINAMPRFTASVVITIPAGSSVEHVEGRDVPGWDRDDKLAGQAFGDCWLSERRSAVLIVPSVVARVEKNLLINPDHSEFAQITASEPEPVIWDKRLFS